METRQAFFNDTISREEHTVKPFIAAEGFLGGFVKSKTYRRFSVPGKSI